MIEEKMAVGSGCSDYKDFDVIVDLNYPENNVKENDIAVIKKNNKLIIKIGLMDADNEDKEKNMYKYLVDVIPLLDKYYKDKRVLFHCFSGVSRSATFAIAYVLYKNNISVENSYEIVKEKRKFILPNNSFIKALHKFKDYIC
jgi:protein-tyrosine phosphatase